MTDALVAALANNFYMGNGHRRGPFIDSSGDLHFVAGRSAGGCTAWRSTDDGANWSSVASVTGIGSTPLTVSSFPDGDTLHVTLFDDTFNGMTADWTVYYFTYDMSTTTFGTVRTVASITGQSSTGSTRKGSSIVKRSDGSLVIFFYGTPDTIMGSSYNRNYYTISTNGGVNWSTPVLLVGAATDEVSYGKPYAILGSDDRAYASSSSGDASTAWLLRSLSSSDVLGSTFATWSGQDTHGSSVDPLPSGALAGSRQYWSRRTTNKGTVYAVDQTTDTNSASVTKTTSDVNKPGLLLSINGKIVYLSHTSTQVLYTVTDPDSAATEETVLASGNGIVSIEPLSATKVGVFYLSSSNVRFADFSVVEPHIAQTLPAFTTNASGTVDNPPLASLPFSDNFNRADGALGDPWRSPVAGWSISGNQAVSSTNNALALVRVGTGVAEVQAKLTNLTSARWATLVGWYADADNYIRFNARADLLVSFFRIRWQGSDTDVGTNNFDVVGSTFRLVISGLQVVAYVDGVPSYSASLTQAQKDFFLANGTRFGLFDEASYPDDYPAWDDFLIRAPTFTGTAASSLPALTQASSGKVWTKGTAAQTLPKFTTAAAGTFRDQITATAASVLPKFSTAASGRVHDKAIVASVLPKFTTAASGKVWTLGTAASTLPKFTQAAAGKVHDRGSITQTLPKFSTAAAGTHVPPTSTGTATSTLGEPTQSAVGRVHDTGSIASVLQAISSSAVGYVPTIGAAAQLLQPVDQAVTGTILVPFLQAAANGSSQVDLTWTNIPQAVGYDIERDGVIIVYNHGTTTYTDTGRTADIEYDYRVRAVL